MLGGIGRPFNYRPGNATHTCSARVDRSLDNIPLLDTVTNRPDTMSDRRIG